jgi:hypothetical protein
MGNSPPAAAAAGEISGSPHSLVKERACRRTQSHKASTNRIVTELISVQCSASTSLGHDGGPVCHSAQPSVGPLCEPLTGSKGTGGGHPVSPMGVLGRPVCLPSSQNPSPGVDEDSSDPDGGPVLALAELVSISVRTVCQVCSQTAPVLVPARARQAPTPNPR